MSRRDGALLVLLLLFLAAVTAAWVTLDRRPPEWDHANHLERAVVCHRILAEPGHERVSEIIAMSSFYPPVVACTAGLLYFLLAIVPLTAQAVMWGFLAVGTLAVYGIGRRLLDAEAGLVAAFLLGTAPFVVFSLTTFQLDLPLAAMVAVTLYALGRAEAFSRPGWSVLTGVALGVGMLTKPPFASYVLPPLAWCAWNAFAAPDRGPRLRRLLLAVGIGLVIALPWYGPRLIGLPMQVLNRSFKQAAESGHAPALTPGSLLYYPRVFQPQFGLLAAPLAAWGLWALRRMPRARGLLWSATLPLVGFLLIQNKNLRYTLPLLPAAALVAAAGLQRLAPAWRRGLTWSCLALGVVQVSSAAFALPPPPAVPPLLGTVVFSRAPDGGDWRHREVLEAILRAAGGRSARVAVVPNDNYFSLSNFRYTAVREQLPLTLTRAWDGPPLGVDFVILKTGDQGPDFASERPDRIMAAFGGGDRWLAAAFPVIAEFSLPDGSRGMVRMRRLEPLAGISAEEVARRLRQSGGGFLSDHAREVLGFTASLEYRAEALLRGEVDRLVIEADSALVGEFARKRPALRLRNIRLSVGGLLFNPRRLVDTGRLEVLDLQALTAERLTVTETDLLHFLRAQKRFTRVDLRLGDGSADVGLGWPGPALSGRVRLVPGLDGSPFGLRAEALRVGGVAVPGPLTGWVMRHLDPAPRLKRLPIKVWLAPVSILPGRIEVGSSESPAGSPPEGRRG
ncbi:MAG: glycosyltransferase family 39 protein [Candidatus Rokubacteria bacterium]|nr:glycosyltransferase family 39 protein [Candidatus Rokubacteria bacterium]